jgi:hypothetical protein
MRKLFFYLVTSIVWLANSTAWSQLYQVDHWEFIVFPHHTWSFLPATSEPPSNWRNITFDDSSWSKGQGGIGYSDGDDSTIIDPAISLFLRKKFDIADTSNIAGMLFYMDYDDAFVAYINGVEIARANIYGVPPPFDAGANTYREALMYNGGLPEEFDVPIESFRNFLVDGENVLCIQVHNTNIGSSDMSSIPFLAVGIRDSTKIYLDPPSWFLSPSVYYSSHLPIISINTFGNQILDEPRIRAEMGIINNGSGEINHLSDNFNGYHGWINIEIRGESAQMFPKKSYSFETQDSVGENNNVALLGLPEENDWILYGPYSDKTLIKNVLSMKLARDMGRYASRTKYCELFINNAYKGLYVLMEKIKQDRNRVDIARLREEDIEGDQLTGGYILRVDKVDPNDYPPFVAYNAITIPNEEPVNIQYFDPDGNDLHMNQREYIRDFIRQFEQALNSGSYLSYFTGYHSYIDKDALVDYLIVNEISKNIDTYIFSTYMYKDRDSKGGKLTMGPVWDFNIGYGNVDYNTFAEATGGWMYNEGFRMYWFRRMINDDPALQNKMSCRWHALRSNIFSDEAIFGYIDSLVLSIQEPMNDNFRRWPVLGQYVWPNSFIGDTHAEEIDFLKNWLFQRLHWMDNNISESCVDALDDSYPLNREVKVFPNPFKNDLYIEINDPETLINRVTVYDLSGAIIWQSDPKYMGLKGFTWNGKNSRNKNTSRGIYIIQLELSNGFILSKKIVKN